MNINYDYTGKPGEGGYFVLGDPICIPLHQKCLTIRVANGAVGTCH